MINTLLIPVLLLLLLPILFFNNFVILFSVFFSSYITTIDFMVQIFKLKGVCQYNLFYLHIPLKAEFLIFLSKLMLTSFFVDFQHDASSGLS